MNGFKAPYQKYFFQFLGGAATSTYDFFRSFVGAFVLPLFVRPEFFYMPFKVVYLNQIKSQECTRIIKTLVGHIFVPTR